jgi:alpha-amylase
LISLDLAECSYDIWDLGEFDQKGSVGTKWGTKEDLLQAIKVARERGIITYIDAVMNHK